MKIINLVSGPRNISTALMYSFAQRKDTTVFDEPFYAVYLHKTGLPHPGREEVLKSLSKQESVVREEIIRKTNTPIGFVKNMAHHMEILDQPLIPSATNVFLIRDPRQIVASYAKVIESPTLRDLGIDYQVQLVETLLKSGVEPVVLDSAMVLRNPEQALSRLCERCGIPFDRAMLHWEKGPKPYDGVWAPHWYSNVHKSSGFELPPHEVRQVPERLRLLSEQAFGLYEKLLPFSIKA